jgi:hypothetical protein
VPLSGISTGPSGTTARNIYRTTAGGSTMRLLATLANNSTTSYTDTAADASLGAALSGVYLTANTVRLTSIATGPSGTTARKLYRTTANGSILKLLDTIANNSTTTYTDTTADASLGAAVGVGTTLNIVNLTGLPLGDATVTGRKLYRTAAGGAVLKLLYTLADNTTTTFSDSSADSVLGAAAPVANTALANRVQLSNIPIGAAAVIARKVYRTAANATVLKLVVTMNDNATTTYTDISADGSLGATAPVADTSGLPQPQGQVNPGQTSLIVAGLTPFSATGGWAIVGNGEILIRYAGVSVTALTGIPASGLGSFTAAIAYNSQITAAPALKGVSGLVLPLIKGAPINIWVQRDDLTAQAARGIIEHRIADERRGEASLAALCDADLALFSAPLVSVTYATYDEKSKSGKPVTFALDSPSIHDTLTIQSVQISDVEIAPGRLGPKFTVQASSVRFSIEDVLRRLTGELEGI